MRKIINRRFIAIALFSILFTAVFMTAVFYTILKRQIFSDLEVVSNLVEERSSYQETTSDVRITLVSKDGTVLFDSMAEKATLENHLDRPEIQAALQNGTGEAVRKSDTLSESVFYYAKRQVDGNVLRVGKEAHSVTLVFLTALPIIIIVAIVLVFVCLFVSHYLTTAIVKPIDQMASDIDHIREEESYPELVPFARKIRMQHEEILSSTNIRQEFTANVSHELKTPLAAISGYAELMESGMVEEKDVQRFSGEIRKGAARLLSLINDIIKLSQLDAGNGEELLDVVNLADVASECVEMMSINASKNDVKLVYEGTQTAAVRVGKELAEELVYNLIQNAIRYNKPGGSVYVKVVNESGEIMFCVEDTGIGIPPEHQERVFERFYRVDKSRSKELGGTGLGLAIVKHICVLTGGELELQSHPNAGTKITIRWRAEG